MFLPQQGDKNKRVECSEDYGGPSPGSELETQHIMNYWRANGPMVGAIDWHSYGKLILHPWGELKHNLAFQMEEVSQDFAQWGANV